MLQEIDESICNANSCIIKKINPNGLGRGRNYANKNDNFPKKIPINQPYNCCSTNKNLIITIQILKQWRIYS